MVPPDATPSGVIATVFPTTERGKQKYGIPTMAGVDDYLLKVPERFEYLAGDHPLTAFRFIRTCLLRDKAIFLRLVHWSKLAIPDSEVPHDGLNSAHTAMIPAEPAEQEAGCGSGAATGGLLVLPLWSVTSPMRLELGEAVDVKTSKSVKFMSVSVCLFHGLCAVTDAVSTPLVAADERCRLDMPCDLGVSAKDLPLESKLLIRIHGHKKASRDADSELGWGLLRLFDHHGHLRQGQQVVTLSYGTVNPFRSTPAEGPIISVCLPTFACPVEHPLCSRSTSLLAKLAASDERPANLSTATDARDAAGVRGTARPRSSSQPLQQVCAVGSVSPP